MFMDLTEFLWQTTSFSEEDIKMLVKQFRMDFPTGNVNKQGAQDVIHRVFPRYDADCLLKNIFEIFESQNAGRVSNNEILWVFSMSMSGTADDKLQWLFKLYDKDQNGEIVQDEFEDIFIKMCRIAEKTEIDHIKKHAKILEEERKKKAMAIEKQREKEMKRSREDMYEEKNKVAVMYSERRKRLQNAEKKRKAPVKKKKKAVTKMVIVEVDEEEAQRDKEKVKELKKIADELCQPQRDCKKFDPVKRAKEIFNALDANGDSSVTEDEFLSGCKSDTCFMKVLDELSMDFLWSPNNP